MATNKNKPGRRPKALGLQTEKHCPRCDETKPRDAFGVRKNGKTLRSYCHECTNKAGSDWAKENRAQASKNVREWRARNRDADRENQRLWKLNNPEKSRECSRRWYYSNLEKVREHSRRYYYYNRERMAEKYREWCANNPSQNAHNTRMYEARKKRAVPLWADADAISKIYEKRDEINEATGISHHVDHIVPLYSNDVCGLHVEENLRVIPARDNQIKSNRAWPDMP